MFKKNAQEDNKTQQEKSSSVDTGAGRSNMFSGKVAQLL